MTEPHGHPDYPVEGGRPALSEAELRTDEHAVGKIDHPVMLQDGFRADAVELLDPAAIHDHPDPDHAVESLGLRGYYGEVDGETLVRCLQERQRELERAGFEAITKDSISKRTKERIAGLSRDDQELLTSYIVCGCPDLDDAGEVAGWVDSLDTEEVEAHKLGLRRAARRLAVSLSG